MTHLSPEALTGYLDRDLPPEEKRQVELHLASCAECREELAEVRQLQRGRPRWRWVPILVPAVAAAAVLIVIGLPRSAQTPSGVRSGAGAEQRLDIVSPPASAEVASGPVTFVWRSAGPGATHTLTLQEEDGRIVWTVSGTDTVAVTPDSVTLAPGRTWFWSVEALLPNGRSLSSGIQRLRTRP